MRFVIVEVLDKDFPKRERASFKLGMEVGSREAASTGPFQLLERTGHPIVSTRIDSGKSSYHTELSSSAAWT